MVILRQHAWQVEWKFQATESFDSREDIVLVAVAKPAVRRGFEVSSHWTQTFGFFSPHQWYPAPGMASVTQASCVADEHEVQ